MAIFEITVKNVSTTDTKTIASLHKITGQSLSDVKEKISHGSPVFSGDISFADCYGKNSIIERLVDCFKENNIDAIIRQDDKIESLNEFLKEWNETRTRNGDGFMDKAHLQEIYMDFLKEEGYAPKIDENDDSVVFKYQGDTFWIDIDSDDQEYFRLVFSGEWDDLLEKHLEEKLYQAASETNAEMKLTKTFIVDKNTVVISIETIMKNHAEFKHNLDRMLRAIQSTLDTFREKMGEIKSKK